MRKHLLSSLAALLPAGLITFGAVGTLSSTYLLSPSPTLPLLLCGVAGLLALLLLPRRHGRTVLLGLSALGLGFVCFLPEAQAQCKGLLMYLSRLLDGVYHLGYLDFPGAVSDRAELPLAVYSCALTVCTLRTLLGKRSCLLPLVLCIPSLLLCALLPTALPAPLPLLCWIAGVMLLLISSGSWKISSTQGTQLIFAAAIPVGLVCLLLAALNPQAEYRDHASSLRQTLLSRVERRLGESPLPAAVIPPPQRSADLSALTGWNGAELPIMIVTAPFDGTLYLRGQSFSQYSGKSWEADAAETEAFTGWGEQSGEVTVRTFALQSVLYLPYYPESGTVLTGGCLENRAGLLSYSFPRCPQGSAAPEAILSECLSLPDSTAAWASQYDFPGSTPGEIAARVGDFVRESAVYDKRTGQMPNSETDFVRWFLTASDTGYCVHFATAAVVLLRAQGIPARYVTGYLCTLEAGKPQVITSLQAHAWAEYYDAAQGSWQILEATAPEALPGPAAAETVPAPEAPVMPDTPASTVPAPLEQSTGKGLSPAWLLLLPGLALFLYLRRLTVLFIRRKRRENASINRRCLLWWAEAQRLGGALGEKVPDPLLRLAERAQYSQHRLTPMDLAPLERYCAQCRRSLEAQALPKRLLHKYILVLY